MDMLYSKKLKQNNFHDRSQQPNVYYVTNQERKSVSLLCIYYHYMRREVLLKKDNLLTGSIIYVIFVMLYLLSPCSCRANNRKNCLPSLLACLPLGIEKNPQALDNNYIDVTLIRCVMKSIVLLISVLCYYRGRYNDTGIRSNVKDNCSYSKSTYAFNINSFL